MIKIQPDKRGWLTFQKLMSEWEERYFAFLRSFAAEAARASLKKVKDQSPTDKQVGFEYKSRLKLANVDVQKFEGEIPLWNSFKKRKKVKDKIVHQEGRACAIIYDGKKELVRELDPTRTILRVKSLVKKPSKGVVILERSNPWTADTLPWIPEEREAELVYEKAEENVIAEVRARRKRGMVRVVNDLKRAGVKGVSLGKQTSGVQNAQAVSSVVKKVLQVEFGIGVRKKRHWRDMIKFMLRKGDREVMKDPRVGRVFGDPTYRGWKQLGLFKRWIDKDDTDDFKEFQTKLSR